MRPQFNTRRILLRTERQRELAVNLISNLPADDEKPLEIRIGEYHQKRSNQQNDLLWAVIDRIIKKSEMGFDSDTWHHFFKQQFLPEHPEEGITKDGYQKWKYMPDGSRYLAGSTTQLTTRGFSDYIEQIYAYMAELGIVV